MLVQSGRRGVTRSELGSAIDLPSEVVDEMLEMLARIGWITATWDGQNHVYRTIW